MADTNDLEVKMLALLERWVKHWEVSQEQSKWNGAWAPSVYTDTRTLLKEAKEVKHGEH